MFGVGGGFLTTPLLILYGIPPTVAAASATTQVTGASVSGVLAHWQRDGVDVRMGTLLVAGGLFGSMAGAGVFAALESAGQMDTVIAIMYVVLLASIGGLMARDAWAAINAKRTGVALVARKRRHHPLVANLPMRWRFYASGLYISPIAPLALGFGVGILTVLLGVGGGFILVPAMIYLLGMSTRVVVGTSLFQILFVTAMTTLIHALTTQAVDIVLAGLLLIGSVVGAQLGTRLASRLPPDWLRLGLAAVILALSLWLALGLGWRPPEIYTVHPL
jgi:uncharacterized membrane protein YfcA